MNKFFPAFLPGDLVTPHVVPILWSDPNLDIPHQGQLPLKTVMVVLSVHERLLFVLVDRRLGYVRRDYLRKVF